VGPVKGQFAFRFANWVAQLVLAALLLYWPRVLTGQTSVITGRVVDVVSGQAVSGAVVTIEGMTLTVRSGPDGAFSITGVLQGPAVVSALKLGYAPVRQSVLVAPADTMRILIQMGRNALRLPGLSVVEDRAGRARGELGTASVIGEEAIRNQTAASLAGVLELVPGAILQSPGIEGVQQFGLRAVPVGDGSLPGAGSAPAVNASMLASFGTQIIVDGVPISNNANLQTLGAKGELQFATAAGGGIDLRRIPASTLERVEVIRGIPSSRYGDLTQGVIIVDTRAGAIDPEGRIRTDANALELTGVAGRELWETSALSGFVNVARSRIEPGFRDNTGTRVSSQISHRAQTRGVRLDGRLGFFQVLDDNPATESSPDFASRSRDRGIHVSERLQWTLGKATSLDATMAYESVQQRSFSSSPQIRGALPFTDRLTDGAQDGSFVGGSYVARVNVSGEPKRIYSRVELLRHLGMRQTLRAGAEMRREWNTGVGYEFDIEFPPQVLFNAVNGYDRPHRFDALPALASSAIYVDDRLTRFIGGTAISLQLGGRVDLMHDGALSRVRDHMAQPRVQVEVSPAEWWRVRVGGGMLAKLPDLGSVSPPPQFYDLVNFNWFANNPAERRAILTTRILDRTNARLGMSRAAKMEVGVEVDLGTAAQTSLAIYRERVSDGIGVELDPTFLLRDRYLVDSATINTGQPPEVRSPPDFTDTVPVLVDRPSNNVTMRTRGVEVTVVTGEIPGVRLRVAAQAAWNRTVVQVGGVDFGTGFGEFQMDERIARAPFWDNVMQTGERLVATTRLIHHQPAVGLVVTGTAQLFLREVRQSVGATDTLGFAGFILRNAQLTRVPSESRTALEYDDLRVPRAGVLEVPQKGPVDWFLNLQVSKSLPNNGRFSMYAFNLLDRVGTHVGRTTVSRPFSPMRFGLEVSMPLPGL
jgi:outer membrane receptor protein involved in Fe transport